MKKKSEKKPKKKQVREINPITLSHRSGWYVHPDLKGQQQRMMG